MTEVLTYEALKAKCDRLEQINAQTLQVKLTMAETIKELTARVNALAVENAGFKHALSVILEHVDVTDKGQAGIVAMIANDELFNSETPATDAALAAIRDKHRAEGINFAANRLLAAFEHGFIDKPAGEVADVAKMILSAVTELPGAPEEDFTRDYSDEVIAMIRAELREAK
ncbi:hypothetical protein LL394_001058 [Serratia marcescens]|uniref:hypothetical protein n=1 Tax=Serratia marcescens TaxID=615 RepID=UPI001A265DCC|nr:hypothetical protein [Serratia marcescens]HAT3801067.1 hypothetical protein [Serratia marcescens]